VTITALMVFALTLSIAAGSPGPSIAALVARVLTNGVRDVLPFLAAMWIGEAIWLTIAVAGLAVLAQSFAIYFIIIKFLGVGYLLFLAAKMWTAATEESGDRIPERQKPWRMFVAGMTVTLGNPKIMVFYLALLPTFVDLRTVTFSSWAELVSTMLIVLATVDLGWALVASRVRRLLSSRRAVRIANRTSATIMVGVAATVAAS
jgi:threonine/homoserine/homoserine lactone efflux protein